MRYLTKSRFKLATECPTKLFYTKKPREYSDQSIEDPFLMALAEGGFQVGELAKAMNPGGSDVKSLDHETSLAETNNLLQQDRVTIFEAAVRYRNLFIRIDVLRKQGNVFDLVEVKAKSLDCEEDFISKKSGKISSVWFPYLIDVAFQEYVFRKAFPTAIVRPYLMLADKSAHTSVDGLNQKFKIIKSNGRTEARVVGDISPESLGEPILSEVDVSEYTRMLQAESYDINGQMFSFEEYILYLASKYEDDEKIPPSIHCMKCKNCAFRTTEEQERRGLKSGFKECWKEAKSFTEQDFQKPNVLDIWNYRKKQNCLDDNRFFMDELTEDDFNIEKPTGTRQWLQVQKTVINDPTPWLDAENLRDTISQWTWPLHFIDFETSAVAIPFNKNRRPYEVVAFQFSHHIIHEDGRIEHADEYLNSELGAFPNFDFVRSLKAALDKDEGTIFRYSHHENTVLNHIARQLAESEDFDDRISLIEWIDTITSNKKSGRVGRRCMVDQCELVKKYYYQLDMGGSNSIKKVLPAVLNSSLHLQKKYSKPTYNGCNFEDMIWIVRDDTGCIKDPYKLLKPIFSDYSQEELDAVDGDERLADGGAAMTAYARMQFSDMPEKERNAVSNALLRYCELDTLAMVMIWEAWMAMSTEI